MAFSWDMLIAPGAALSGVGLTLFATSMRERTQFQRQVRNTQLDNRRTAYSNFLCSSDRMEQIERQIIAFLEQGAAHRRRLTEEEKKVISQGPDQVAEMRRTRAILEIDGTPDIASCGRYLYQAHAEFEPLLAAAINARQYETSAAKTVLEEIENARQAFVFACRQELALPGDD